MLNIKRYFPISILLVSAALYSLDARAQSTRSEIQSLADSILAVRTQIDSLGNTLRSLEQRRQKLLSESHADSIAHRTTMLEKARLRARPSRFSEVTGEVHMGALIEVHEYENEMLRVSVLGKAQSGWVKAAEVDKKGPIYRMVKDGQRSEEESRLSNQSGWWIELRGSGELSSMTVFLEGETSVKRDLPLPVSRRISASSGDFVSVTAQLTGQGGSATIEIRKDGVVKASHKISGAYATGSASVRAN